MFKIWSIHYTHTKQKHTNDTWDFSLLLKHVKIQQHYVDLPLRQNQSSPHFLLVPAWLLFSQVSPLPLALNLLAYLCYLPGTYSHLHLPHVQQIASNINIASPIVATGYKLNKQGDSIQPCHNSFTSFEPVSCPMFGSNCCFLTHTQVSQETGKVVWYSHIFKNFPPNS